MINFDRIAVAGLLLCCSLNLAAAQDQQPPGDAPNSDGGDPWRLAEPFWSGSTVHGESVLFVQDADGGRPSATVLRKPTRVTKLQRADRTETFEEGRDFTVDAASGRLVLPEGSRIPFLTSDQLYPPAGSPRSIPHVAGDTSRAVLFDNEHWFHDQQVEVTYETEEAWRGYRPEIASRSLPRTLEKLRGGEPLNIAVTGDSITYGYNASGLTGAPPRMPIYPELVVEYLRAHFDSPIEMTNNAVGGWRLEHGLEHLDELLKSEPDLMLIAYGMNHFGSRDPEAFKRLQAEMLDRIWSANPDTEIILVAPMHGNPDWVHTPRDQFGPHRDVLASFVGPRVALADLTTLWGQMLERKKTLDLTGNGVNHPNDFGHRVYASVVLGLLTRP